MIAPLDAATRLGPTDNYEPGRRTISHFYVQTGFEKVHGFLGMQSLRRIQVRVVQITYRAKLLRRPNLAQVTESAKSIHDGKSLCRVRHFVTHSVLMESSAVVDQGMDGVRLSGLTAVETGPGGLPKLVMTNSLGDAEISFLGATVTHFAPKGKKPVLWVSPKSAFQIGKGIRGGVPVCWPWFANHPTKTSRPAHGLLRSRLWRPVDAAALADGRTRVRFEMKSNDETRAIWDYEFSAQIGVTVGSTLEIDFSVENTGREPFLVEEALHTYFQVGEVRDVRVCGLDGAVYIDKTAQGRRHVQVGDFTFQKETDAVFPLDRSTVCVADPVLNRTITITKRGSDSTVLWNPWVEKAQAMGDMGPGTHSNMVCVESANCHEGRYSLPPGLTHHLVVEIAVKDGI